MFQKLKIINQDQKSIFPCNSGQQFLSILKYYYNNTEN